MIEKFEQLRHRDQIVLVIGAAFVILFVMVVGFWMPLADKAQVLSTQNEATASAQQRVDEMAGRIVQLREAGGKSAAVGGGGNLSQLINSRAGRYGLKISRMQPNTRGEIQVRFDDAAFSSVLSWLHQLELVDGVSTLEVSVTQAGAPGLVNATIRVGKA